MGNTLEKEIMQVINEEFVMIHYPNTKFGKFLNNFIIGLTFFSILIMILGSVKSINDQYGNMLFYMEIGISIFFGADYTYRFFKSKHKGKFVINFYSIIELLSFLPSLVEALFAHMIGAQLVQVMRVWKVFRILRLSRYFSTMNNLKKAIKNNSYKYEIAFLLLFLIWIISGFLMYAIEGDINHAFNSIPNALWWSIVTMSTVGYGDMYPVSALGKTLGGIVILLGPVFLAIISSITVITFLDVVKYDNQQKRRLAYLKSCEKCSNHSHDSDAVFCKMCGSQLSND